MKNHILLISLAVLAMICAVLEGLAPGLPPQFIQLSGLLTIVSAGALVVWTLKVQAWRLGRD